MKKILIINDIVGSGGVETMTTNFISILSSKFIVLSYSLFKPDKKYLNTKHNFILPFTLQFFKKYLNSPLKIFLLIVYRFTLLMYSLYFSQMNYDFILGMKEGDVLNFISKIKGSEKILFVHTDYDHFNWTKYYYKSLSEQRNVYLSLNKVVCVSNKVFKSLETFLGPLKNAIVIPNSMDCNFIWKKSKSHDVNLLNYKFNYPTFNNRW